ncbi:MAG: manganese efflux pump [Clostridiales bacterium]|nr:manganese efflux pump [Clostridiales bacterium]
MSIAEIVLLGIALSMDACAVGMTDGMTHPKMRVYRVTLIAVLFGFFQFLMPLLGYYVTGLLADAFLSTFEKISAWVSFGLLAFLGGKMVFDAVSEWREAKREKEETDGAGTSLTAEACPHCLRKELGFGQLILQAIATSIDALAVGVTLQMAALSSGLALGAWGATCVIGVITLGLVFGAVYIGKAIGNKLADKAEFIGGLVLVAIGVKILLETLL